MKNYLKSLLLATFLAPAVLSAQYSDYYGLPGDDFSLEGALDLFKRSNSLEEFERALNAPENDVNNLDLNYNGRIDYLRVVDHAEGDFHAIVIQALVGRNVSQDVAVIEVKRNYYGEAVVQIVGDEDLYGTAKIVEPYPYDDLVGTDYYDDYYDHYSPNVFVNVWYWPSVRFIFAPRYVVWVSPWYYDYYPVWYSTWHPRPRHIWHTRTVVYNNYYCVAPQYRIPEVRHFYGPRRMSAPEVHRRTELYVQEHGGRSNFTHDKRHNAAVATGKTGLDRPANAGVAARSGQKSVENPAATKPRTENRSYDRSEKPAVATRPEVKREEKQATKPRTENRNAVSAEKSGKGARPDVKREEKQATKSRTENRKQEAAPSKSARGNSTAARPATETRSRPATSSGRKTEPSAKSSPKNQNRSSSQAQPSTERKAAPAAPKVNRPEAKSKSGSTSGSKAPAKSKSSQPRKGKG